MEKVLVVRRYKPLPRATKRELVLGKKAMSKPERKARKTLEVKIMFEPSRLAAEYLADAYAQVAPIRRRSISTDKISGLTVEESQRRERA